MKAHMSPRLINTLFVAALFMVVANPVVYGITDKMLGRPLRMPFTQNGVPTRIGIIVHSIVFALMFYFFLGTQTA